MHRSSPQLLRNASSFKNSKKILRALGDPQDALPAVHIAATSGKGSTLYALDAVLRSHGFSTTLIVSPHAYDIRERIQQNGDLIGKDLFVKLANQLFRTLDSKHLGASYFEVMMSIGFLAAAHKRSDYMLVETGLGGMWDTSNCITRTDKIALIGSIGYDHVHILGNTLPAIAAQKAGIMARGGTVIALRQSSEINDVFEQTAEERGSNLSWIDPAETSRATNQRFAHAAAQALADRDGWQLNTDIANQALNQVTPPGRFELRTLRDSTVVLDAAHNEQKAQALAQWLHIQFPRQLFTTIIALSHGKDASAIIEALNPITAHYICTTFFTDEADTPVLAMNPNVLANAIETHGQNQTYTVEDNPVVALKTAVAAGAKHILITGSFYLLGEIGNSDISWVQD